MNKSELIELRDKKRDDILMRFEKEAARTENSGRMQILICGGTGCQSSSSMKIIDRLQGLIDSKNLTNDIIIVKTGCFGLCAEGPIVVVYPDHIIYGQVGVDDVEEIFESHILNGEPVYRLIPGYDENSHTDIPLDGLPFFTKQKMITLRNCGVIAAENIDEYIGRDGYMALAKVLTEMTPDDVINTLSESQLRGRGGGGFPTAVKWSFAKDQPEGEKFVCCNADEGDPGAFMDRSVLEGDPHSVIEAMIIAGYTIGANQGYIYVRAEYPVAVERLKIAIEQAEKYGLLGKNILETGFSFDLGIKLGEGAFVCGEETALISSIEGRRGEPQIKPPFPAVKGLFGKPTLLNNVETFATIPQIILNGAKWYASVGTEKSKGTKVFALGGKINNIGLVEVPMGTTLREIIFDIGGGIPGGKKFKAAQTGGPSGGCIPAEHLDTPIDYDNLLALGSMMGSGGLIVMDEETCMVDLAKFFLEFTVDESCGKCVPCRLGTKEMYNILCDITGGRGTLEDIKKLEDLAEVIKNSSLCGLGQTAPNPVLSTLRYFRHEYIAHIVDKQCPAGVCKAMRRFTIDDEICKRCGICVKNCPQKCIEGSRNDGYKINQNTCIKCGACKENCPFGAIFSN